MKRSDLDRRMQLPGRGKCLVDIDRIPHLAATERRALKAVTNQYSFRATPYYLDLVNWDDPKDPIRRLIVPHTDELLQWGDLDPSKEESVTVAKGVQHKYPHTVLLLCTQLCASFCRYCFRKRLFMEENEEVTCDIGPGLDYIRSQPQVSNVLLTGGDPMVLSTARLRSIIAALREIDHVRIIRIGTKMPAFDPYRFLEDKALAGVFRKYSLPDRRIYMICHFDHPRELTPEAREAIGMVIDAGVICVNQTPISRGISDDPEDMAVLWNELSYMGVPQYYVFQGRPTAGNRPYVVPIVEAYHRIELAKQYCSGLAKRIKYVMSHATGKIEMIGVDKSRIYLKYHRAKRLEDEQRIMICHRDDSAYWMDHLKPLKGYHHRFPRSHVAGEADTHQGHLAGGVRKPFRPS